jgi:hypothetical protein
MDKDGYRVVYDAAGFSPAGDERGNADIADIALRQLLDREVQDRDR